MATIRIPVLFDMSGDTLVFGEEVPGDFVSSHLDFLLDMTTEANDISLNAADISSAILIGDQDSGDNIFYSGGTNTNITVDNLCNRIAKAVTRGKLVHIPKTGNSSNSGIPMGGRLYIVRADGVTEVPPDGKYATKYSTSIAPIGDEQMLGEAMARVTSVHLMGTPLAAAILVDKNSVQTDLETASSQTFNSGGTAFYNAFAVQLSKVLGGSKSSAPMKPGGRPKTYTVVEPSDYDINKTVPARLATAAENQLLTDLLPSLRIVTGNSNAIFYANIQQGPWSTGPKGYYAIDLSTTATDNKYELTFNTHATPTGTGSEGGAYGQNYWGIHINAPLGTPLDASGVACPALKSIYEQLMGVPGRSQIMQTRDISGVVNNSNTTLAGGFPFIAGDKLVMYLRPKIVFAAQTQASNNNALYTFNYTGSTVLAMPSYNIADKTGTITAQTYTQSSSQDNTNFIFEHATDGNGISGNQYWTSANLTYNNTTGVHGGTNATGSTTGVDGSTTIAGEWGQVDIGELTFATELKLTTNNSYNDRAPREFRLLGSTNGTAWITLIHQTEAGPWVDSTAQTFTIASQAAYRYYRYIVIKCYNAVTEGNIDTRTSIGFFNLRGTKYPSEVIENTNMGLMDNSPLDISGLQTNVVAATASISAAFPGNANTGPEAESSKWGWMGSSNSDSFTLDSTDVTDPKTIDLHIWKITVTL